MTPAVAAVVLASAVLHAAWNAIVKRGDDAFLSAAIVAASSSLIALLAVPFLPPVGIAAWPFVAASTALEVVYYGLVAAAYTFAPMSQVYPLMRGTPPLIVCVVSVALLGTSVSIVGLIAVCLISLGVMTLAFAKGTSVSLKGTSYALLNACIIASYTLVDGLGVQQSGSPISYAMWIFALTGGPVAVAAFVVRPNALSYFKRNWLGGFVGGFGTLTAYSLALWAMTQAPVPLVAALRETSILFGTVLAAFMLRERPNRNVIVAATIIAAGALLMPLSKP